MAELHMLDTPSPPTGGASAPARGKGRKRTRMIDLRPITRLLDSFSLIYGTKTVWDDDTRRIVPVDALRLAMGQDAVKAWLAAPNRKMVMPEDLQFEPGVELPAGCINLFDGLDVEPLPCPTSDVAPMLQLLRHLCSASADNADECDEVMEWVLRWCALPLQKVGTKMQTAIVMHGPQGTGKNLFWDCWRDLFGRYGITVGQTELEDKFNDWLSAKLAIVGDEVVSRQEMYHNKNRLKLVVTQGAKFPIRAPHMSTRWESNHANVVFLSNEGQPLAIEERDRRYMVVYTPLASEPELYTRVRAFLDADGARKWLHYLQTYPLDGFNAHTKPMMTRAKSDLVRVGWRPAQRFGYEWLAGLLPLPLHPCSVEQLYRAFRRWADQNGERFPPAQAIFTTEMRRWVAEREASGDAKALVCKEVNLDQPQGGRKTVRCWIPKGTGPRDGQSEAKWVTSCVEDWDKAARRFSSDLQGADGGDS
jgi:putative DNA primase/helicase